MTHAQLAKDFVKEMMPKPGIVGVDIGSMAYKEQLDHYVSEHGADKKLLEEDVKNLMRQIGEEGFSILSED